MLLPHVLDLMKKETALLMNNNGNFKKVFSDRLTITLAGITLELIHAPGETNDQIIVWYPDQVSNHCDDNL